MPSLVSTTAKITCFATCYNKDKIHWWEKIEHWFGKYVVLSYETMSLFGNKHVCHFFLYCDFGDSFLVLNNNSFIRVCGRFV